MVSAIGSGPNCALREPWSRWFEELPEPTAEQMAREEEFLRVVEEMRAEVATCVAYSRQQRAPSYEPPRTASSLRPSGLPNPLQAFKPGPAL